MKPFNLLLQTDAYHHAMGLLLRDPMEIESYVLYARRGGPQIVPDLAGLLREILSSKPEVSEIQQAAAFWKTQGVPFPEDAWLEIAQMQHLPLEVRGVRDGEVVLPGDPIAVFTGPSALVASLEPILEARMMTSMQTATRFAKCVNALDGDTGRLFEVGLRAAASPQDHLAKLAVLKRMGLAATSNGEAAQILDIKAVGTMGHRYTQRFTGDNADHDAFDEAVTRMLGFRAMQDIKEVLPLSFLLDTRNTLARGLPAALSVMRERHREIAGRLALSVRLDSGDLRAQFRQVVEAFKTIDAEQPALRPRIIVESGLTAAAIAEFETLAECLDFPRERVLYGLGGYLVGGIDRDAIALVYKITAFGGRSMHDAGARVATMKFGDEAGAGKESYPGDFELWEQTPEQPRVLALAQERLAMSAKGYQSLFRPLAVNGSLWQDALFTNAEVQAYNRRRWREVTGGYVQEEPDYVNVRAETVRRPQLSAGMQALTDTLRNRQVGNPGNKAAGVAC